MKKLEKILWILFLISITMKLMHWPGGSLGIVISLGIVSNLYFIFSFGLLNNISFRNILKKESFANVSSTKMILVIIIGFALSVLCIGILFKLLFWPGSFLMQTIGLGILTISGIIPLILKSENNKQLKPILMRFILIGGLGLVVFITPSRNIAQLYYGDNAYTDKFIERMENPSDLQIQRELDSLREIRIQEEINREI